MSKLPEYRNLIGGEMRPPVSGKMLDAINPATGAVWARVPASGKADADAAVAAAVAAFPAWSALVPDMRAHYMRQAALALREFGDELTRLEMMAIGCCANIQGRKLTAHSGPYIFERHAGATLEAIKGMSVPLDANRLGITIREPFGVVAAIVPFNAPFSMACSKISLAIAAGNSVVVKPPEQATPAILRMGELLCKALPPGVVNMVSGLGAEVGDALVRNPAVRKITMTGSAGTAKVIQRAAADNLTSAIFELGGKSPNIVFADADLDHATIGVTTMSIYTTNAGQACCGGSRILIQRPVLDEMITRIKDVLASIKVGDPFDPATTMGPVVSRAQFDKVVGYIECGKQETQLLYGGRYGAEVVPSLPGGYWVEPTLFMSNSNNVRICREEIFGPVATIIPFDTEEEAIAIANDSVYGLASGVWTRDMARTHRMIRAIRAGNVWVNTYMETRAELPFAGIKESGYGHDDLLEFTQEKAAVISIA